MKTSIKSIIIDDDVRSRNILSAMIFKYCDNAVVVGEASNIDDAITLINEIKPELVFLDVDLGLGTGFDLLAQTTKETFQTIFVTAHSSYAIKAIKWSAQDYLLKPVDPEELVSSVNKAMRVINSEQAPSATDSRSMPLDRKNIGLPSIDGLKFVYISDIIRCEAKRAYTEFYLANNKKILVSKPLQVYEDILEPYRFFRIHKSHLINTDYIKEYIKGRGGTVVMSDNTVISVASRKKEEFLNSILH